MSFPVIPDINPEISITREDAVNLLLISIALEEISLADLIDAETKKICFVAGKNECHEHSVQDLKDINYSVNKTLQDIIKLQMLLQFKLENVIEVVNPTTTTTSTTTTTTTTTTTKTSTTVTTTRSTSTTTTTKTSTSTTSTCSSTTKKECASSCKSCGHGIVLKRYNLFLGHTVIAQSRICANATAAMTKYCVKVYKRVMLWSTSLLSR